MADQALQKVADVQKDFLAVEYGGRMSNQFVDQLKSSTMFQFDWSELLSAAPAALSTLGSCWIASAVPMADQISMKNSMPTKGFAYLTNRSNPSLRSCLVDVCEIGGRQAFVIAGENMTALCINSKRICDERIPLVFAKLGKVTQSQDDLEDFKDALNRMTRDANECSKLARETRLAFNKWGLMCSELQSCSEAEITTTAIKREAAKIDEEMAVLEKQFSTEAKTTAEDQVKQAAGQLSKAEKRLDTALDKVPGPWQSIVQTAITGWTQAVPHIVAAVLPTVLAASNPLAGAALALKGPSAPPQVPNGAPNGTVPNAPAGAIPQTAPTVQDPAYATATAISGQVSHFYDYLGGDTGPVDWSKFGKNPSDPNAPSGIVYVLGNFTGQRTNLDTTNTDANMKIMASLDSLIKVATEIKDNLALQQNEMSPKLENVVLAGWKRDVKQAKGQIITLATVDTGLSTNKTPVPFARVEVPKADLSAQTAQTNAAMDGVHVAQAAVDLAESNYQQSVARQAKTAAALSAVEQKLKALQSTGKTLEQIKSILRDAISILVDLTVQIGKIEQFFIMLSTVIDYIVMPKVRDFEEDMRKAGDRGFRNGFLKFDDMAQQTIYMTTLQLRGYFSLLQDIAGMYTEVHHKYILPGVNMCTTLSGKASTGNATAADQQALADYSEKSAIEVNKLVKAKQEEILNGLRARAKKAAEESSAIAAILTASNVPIDNTAKLAIEAGKQATTKQAEAVMNAAGDPFHQSKEVVDANAF